MSQYRYKRKKRIKALLFYQGGICGLLILCLIFGLSNSAGAFSTASGDTCEGLSTGMEHTCVLTSVGNVDCYGNNLSGRADDYTGENAVSVSAGWYHTCVLTSNGNVDCYGDNSWGQAQDYTGGDAFGVSTGSSHTCVLTSDGNVDCYGNNLSGRADDYTGGDAVEVSAGSEHTCILTSGGNVDCYGNNWDGQAEDYTGGDAVMVSAGGEHTCVLTSGGNVDCYGANWYAQAQDYTGGDAVMVSAGGEHTCVLTSNGNVDCYGNNWNGQAEDYSGGDAIGVAAGGSDIIGHTCVLTSDGNVDCYGSNSFGQSEDYNGGDAVCTQIIPLPTSKQSFFYPAVSTRIMNMNPNMAKPVGVGSIADDGWYLAVNIGLFRFSGLIDMYGAYTVSTDPQTVNVLNPNGSSFTSFTMDEMKNALSTGIPPVGAQPWITNTEGHIYKNLLGTIAVSTLPSGTYTVYLLVTPTGNLSSYYLWITSFIIPDNTFITWEKTLGGINGEVGTSVQQTSDGGYITVGRTFSYSNYTANFKVYLVKTDEYGNVLWEKTYGITGRDVGNSVQQTSDGGYIIAGNTSFLRANSDVYLIKTDADSNVVWEKTFGGEEDSESGYSVQQTTDGGYIVAGGSVTYHEDDSSTSDVYLIKTDAHGNVVWEKTFGGEQDSESGYSVQQTMDGGYIVAGRSVTYYEDDSSTSDVYLIKADADGNIVWEKTHGGENYDSGYSVQQTSDGGYIIAGNTSSYGAGSYDVYLIKTDEDGTVVWEKTFGDMESESGYSAQQTSDGGYVIAGYKGWFYFDEMIIDGDDLYLIKTDAEGDI